MLLRQAVLKLGNFMVFGSLSFYGKGKLLVFPIYNMKTSQIFNNLISTLSLTLLTGSGNVILLIEQIA